MEGKGLEMKRTGIYRNSQCKITESMEEQPEGPEEKKPVYQVSQEVMRTKHPWSCHCECRWTLMRVARWEQKSDYREFKQEWGEDTKTTGGGQADIQ